jgi:hypothetical protein
VLWCAEEFTLTLSRSRELNADRNWKSNDCTVDVTKMARVMNAAKLDADLYNFLEPV